MIPVGLSNGSPTIFLQYFDDAASLKYRRSIVEVSLKWATKWQLNSLSGGVGGGEGYHCFIN